MLATQSRDLTAEKKDKFAFWFVFSLILNGYATGVPGVSMGSAVLIIMIIISIINDNIYGEGMKITPVMKFGFFLTISSFLGNIIVVLFYSELSTAFSTKAIGLMKFWTWVIFSSIVAKRYYDQKYITKWMVRFSIVLTVYLFIQCLFYYGAHIYLPNIIKFGPIKPYVEGYADYERLGQSSILRPAALLSESSFYGNIIICTTLLFLEKNVTNLHGSKLAFVVFLTCGIIFSGSTSAIIFQSIILVIYFRRINNKAKTQMVFFGLILFIVIGLLFFDKISNSFLGESLEYSFGKFEYLDKSTRFGKSYNYLNLLPDKFKIFGVGIGSDNYVIQKLSGNDIVYLNSATSLLAQTGYVGFIMFTILVLKLILDALTKKSMIAICLIIVYFAKGFASGIYFSTYGILFMFIIVGQLYYCKENNRCEKYQNDIFTTVPNDRRI